MDSKAREKALLKIQGLIAKAAEGSGASEDEARTAAVTALRMMAKYELAPGTSAASAPSAPLDAAVLQLQISNLQFQVLLLKNKISEMTKAHQRELADEKHKSWQFGASFGRQDEQQKAKEAVRHAEKVGASRGRRGVAASGGKARARSLTSKKRSEIAQKAAKARWSQRY